MGRRTVTLKGDAARAFILMKTGHKPETLAVGLDFEALEYLAKRHPEIGIWKRTENGISGWSRDQISGMGWVTGERICDVSGDVPCSLSGL